MKDRLVGNGGGLLSGWTGVWGSAEQHKAAARAHRFIPVTPTSQPSLEDTSCLSANTRHRQPAAAAAALATALATALLAPTNSPPSVLSLRQRTHTHKHTAPVHTFIRVESRPPLCFVTLPAAQKLSAAHTRRRPDSSTSHGLENNANDNQQRA